jgi:hypothetical protein
VRLHAKHALQRQTAGRATGVLQVSRLDVLGQLGQQAPAMSRSAWLLASSATLAGRAGYWIDEARLFGTSAEHPLAQVAHLTLQMLNLGNQGRFARGRLGQLVVMAQRDPTLAFNSAFM